MDLKGEEKEKIEIEKDLVGWLDVYGISTLDGYLMWNPVYTFIYLISKPIVLGNIIFKWAKSSFVCALLSYYCVILITQFNINFCLLTVKWFQV